MLSLDEPLDLKLPSGRTGAPVILGKRACPNSVCGPVSATRPRLRCTTFPSPPSSPDSQSSSQERPGSCFTPPAMDLSLSPSSRHATSLSPSPSSPSSPSPASPLESPHNSRSPQPHLFFQARAQKGRRSSQASSSRQNTSRSSSSTSSLAAPSSSTSLHHLPSSSTSSSTVAPSPKLNSLAATHKLKKDIHRCHRMSRRPLPRSDPTGPTFSNPGGPPSRMHVSPFSETVRILNRRVKPREVKRGRIILNLKVIDKPGRGGTAAGGRNTMAGRQNIPSRNRIIGKKGEGPYRSFQPPLKMLGFPMYGKPFGLQCGGPVSFHSHPGSCSSTGTRQSHTPSSQYLSPPSPSSSSGSEEKSPTNKTVQSQPDTEASSLGKDRFSETQEGLNPNSSASALSSDANPVASTSTFLPSSPSSSLEDEEDGAVDHLLPTEGGRKNPCQRRAKYQLSTTLPSDSSGKQAPASGEPQRVPAEGDPDWHPELAPSCKDVVVTDVTTNLVTVTIKEFPSHASGPASPSASPKNASPPPPATSQDPSI